MRLLVMGGTEFVGRAVVEEALARGEDVTVFNRGRNPTPPGARALRGDRTAEGGLDALREGEWDAVVDTWAGAPRAVLDAATLLEPRVGRYAYVSSRSVYTFPAEARLDEDGPVVAAHAGDASTDYAADKRGGELAAQAAFGPDRALCVRAGLILGPYENIGRLPWWLARTARGGPVLAPGPRDLPLQYIDVRDLAIWTLDAVRAERSGPYNVVSAPGHTTMEELLRACVAATASGAELCWTDPEAIAAAGIEPWTQLPVWLPLGELHGHLHQGDVSKALAAGLRCRPVEETVRDTWAWMEGLGGPVPQRADRPEVGVDPKVEAALLADAHGVGPAPEGGTEGS